MKAWEIVAWSYDGALYHAECKPKQRKGDFDEPKPVFASDELEPLDYCDTCLHKWIHEHPGQGPARKLNIFIVSELNTL